MNLIIFPLLAGHFIADFWLQPDSWVRGKKELGLKSSGFWIHVAIASVLPVLFTFRLNLWWFAPVIFVSHAIIDFFKTKLKDNIAAFVADQLLHVAVLAILAAIEATGGMQPCTAKYWIYITGFVIITRPVGIFTGKFLEMAIPGKNNQGKVDVSAWIGILERALIYIFILSNQFSAIGFLIAAKSVFRFNDTREEGNKKAEYFLLGTLISFAFAIAAGLAAVKAVSWVQHL